MGWVRCMSSSPDRTPLFSKTLLCDNSSKSSSFSVSDSLSNYDFIEFITDDGSDNTNHFYMTENCIQDIEDLTDTTNKYICFNNFDTNQYVCYTRSGNTWTKAGSRLLNIITVNGFKCANMTMTETMAAVDFLFSGLATTTVFSCIGDVRSAFPFCPE